ncbi:uncharacterized protein LOC143731931 isoform X1 [Siphateles boraxobius]|uniref:uncharacterized protein LOC143731931 isoform X1 n=1 Tax=Siphateles boraxobius TaxID=180520 RepID=UPI004064824D
MYLHFNLLKRITIFFFYEQDWKESCGGSRFPLLDFWRSATDSREETEPFKESPMVTECFRETPQTAATAETSAKTQIEVIKGSGVFCQAQVWKAARCATSATTMVWNLLLGTF